MFLNNYSYQLFKKLVLDNQNESEPFNKVMNTLSQLNILKLN